MNRLSRHDTTAILKEKLQAYPYCHWCHHMVYRSSGGAQEPRGATIDHIRSKPECVTRSEYRNRHNLVLACYRCNQARNDVMMEIRNILDSEPIDLGVHLDRACAGIGA